MLLSHLENVSVGTKEFHFMLSMATVALLCCVTGDLPVGNRIQSGYCCLYVNTVDEVMTFPKSLYDVIDFLDVVSVLAGVGHEYDGVYEGGGGGKQDGA